MLSLLLATVLPYGDGICAEAVHASLRWGVSLAFDAATQTDAWRAATEAAIAGGLNQVVVRVSDVDLPPSLTAEVARLRTQGVAVVPQVALSADARDDAALAVRRVRTVRTAFGNPPIIHLGLGAPDDAVFKALAADVRTGGARPWAWSDRQWTQPDAFFAAMPKDVLQSNRYFGDNFDLLALWDVRDRDARFAQLDAYGLMDIEGYDQVPTGTAANFSNTVAYCSRAIARKHLKGFLLMTEESVTDANRARILAAIDVAVQAKRAFESRPKPRVRPARDYASDPVFVRTFHDAVVRIAQRKCFPAKPELGLKAHIGTGGNFGGYFLWDTCFNVLWGAKEPKGTFPVLESMDNLYRLADAEGFVNRQYEPDGRPTWDGAHPIAFAPPLMAWAEWDILASGLSDAARLAVVYPKLVRHHRACARRFRRADGLYFGDWFGCGMDDLPRWPNGLDRDETIATGVPFTKETVCGTRLAKLDGRMERCLAYYHWNRQAGWIDLSSQMALDALCLARLATAVERDAEAAAWRAEHAELAAAINARCWSEELGFYCDVGPQGIIPRRHAGGFWALLAEVAPKARAARVVRTLMDPNLFNRPTPFPTLPADDPDYGPDDPHSYSCGVVWPPTNYALICGLRAAGFAREAEDAARRWYNAAAELFVAYGTVMENMSPEQCGEKRARSQGDFCGWGALVPLALPRDFGWLK